MASSLPPSEYTGLLLPTPPQNSSFFQPSEPTATDLRDIESADSSHNVVEPPSKVTRDWLAQTAASSQRLRLTAIAMGRSSYFFPMAQMSCSQSLMISLCHTHHLQLPWGKVQNPLLIFKKYSFLTLRARLSRIMSTGYIICIREPQTK